MKGFADFFQSQGEKTGHWISVDPSEIIAIESGPHTVSLRFRDGRVVGVQGTWDQIQKKLNQARADK